MKHTLMSTLIVISMIFSSVSFGQNFALNLDGVDDRIVIADAPELNPTGAFTLEIWINAESWESNIWAGTIIGKQATGPDNGYCLTAGDGGRAEFTVGVNGAWQSVATNAILSLNTWHHLACVYDESNIYLYVDGDLKVSSGIPATYTPSTGTDLVLGDNPTWPGRNFHGTIDEARITGVAKTASEISTTYTQEFTGTESDLLAFWPMNEGTGTNVGDLVNTNNGTMTDMDENTDWVGGFVVPTCPMPNNLVVIDISATDAIIAWTPGGSETSWNIEYGPSGFTQGTGTTAIQTDTFNVMSSLTANTTYDFYLQADCGSGDLSEWVGPFSFTTLLSCQFPSGLTASNITSTSATLSWIIGDAETNWNVEYGEDGFTQGTGTSAAVADTFLNISSLNAITTYQFYVQADCGGGDLSPWSGPYSFTTPCDVFTPDYAQDFEGSFTPDCWEENEGPVTGPTGTAGTSAWNSGTLASTGSSVARINLYNTGDEDWLLSPIFDLSAGGVYLTFDVAVYPYSGSSPIDMGSDDEVQLLYTTDNGTSWSALKSWNQGNSPSINGDHFALDMASQTSTNIQFAFWATEGSVDDAEDYYFCVDNFEIRPVSVETDIITYSFPDQVAPATIDASAHTVTIQVGSSINLDALVADFTLSPYATATVGVDAQESGTTVNNFTSPVVYTIEAEDGSTSEAWTVTVTQASANTDANFTSYSFPQETGPAVINDIDNIVDIIVLACTDLTSLVAEFTLPYGATSSINGVTQESGVTANDFTSAVTDTIYAEDGSYEVWTINVTAEPAFIVNAFTWTESFEGDFAPHCWMNNTWGQSTYGTAHTGSEWAYSNTSGSELVTPEISIPDTDNYTLSYWYRAESSGYPQDFEVLLSTDGINFDVTIQSETGYTNADYVQMFFDLGAYGGQSVWIKFVGQSGSGGFDYGVCLDDVEVYLGVPDGISEPVSNSDVKLYPNPNNGQFKLALDMNLTEVNIEIVNTLGQSIRQYKNINTNEVLDFDLSQEESGLYFIRIYSGEQMLVKKVNITK